ncbi:uncharacterized protein LOC131672849 [Phymastichus coffea]|uniref:uncharacterized protein LOC131672849 n=1 Tax=Phymastichus coffea TaxID=108790 RepID=UPI00273C9235|nr:uncharacterized protein LOC131672849 [Phymastichus coffea]
MDIDSSSSNMDTISMTGSQETFSINMLHSNSHSDITAHSCSSDNDTDSLFLRLRQSDQLSFTDNNEQSDFNVDVLSNSEGFNQSHIHLDVNQSQTHSDVNDQSCAYSDINHHCHINRDGINVQNNDFFDIVQDMGDCLTDSSDDEDFNNFNNLAINDNETVENRFERLDEIINDEDYNEPLHLPIGVSRIEMILAVMKYCNKYHIPTTGMVDLFKMLNMFVDKKVFPDNRYQLDMLFNPEKGREYHAVCPVCKVYLGIFKKGQRLMFCEVCDMNVNLKDPLFRDYFVILDVVSEIQDLIESNEDFYIDVVSRRNKEVSVNFKDFFDGQRYKQFLVSLSDDRKENYITLTLNSDGSPTFKSSKCSIWPIQILINELPLHVRSEKTIVCALWFGRDKPNMTYFLRPFVEKMNELSENGIPCKLRNEMKNIHSYVLCCCVDTVARAPMQGFVQFNGYFGCSWCLHPGASVRHNTGYSMKYIILDEHPERRTADDTLQLIRRSVEANAPIYGVKNATPLLLLNSFNIIYGFVPCPMHCVDRGVGNQFCNYWFASSNEPYTVPKSEIKRINQLLSNFKVPTQLIRLSRSLSDRAFWKAAEWLNWILFYSAPILKLISEDFPEFERYMNHWFIFVEAYYILLQTEITVTELKRADSLLKQFVFQTELLYGRDAMTYNVHQLLHLAQSVADWGPLYVHSGYVFESGNGKIKQTIYAAKGVLSQVCRHLYFKESIRILQKHVEAKDDSPCIQYVKYLDNGFVENTVKFAYRYFGRTAVDDKIIELFQLPKEQVRAFRKMVKDRCLFMSSKKKLFRSDNSHAVLKNGNYIEIEHFIINF